MPLAALPLLLLPYDSITHLLGLDPGRTSQTLPATALFSIAYVLLRGGELRLAPAGRAVLRSLVGTLACIALITFVYIAAEASLLLRADLSLRLYAAARQGTSLLLGFTSFLMFHDAIATVGVRSACRWILVGAVPTLLLCALQLVDGSPRVQGFSSEPSHLGDFLVLAFLPACFFAGLGAPARAVLLAPGSFALLAAFSGTAMMKGAFALFGAFAARRQLLRAAGALAAVAGIAWWALSFYPDNYIFHLIDLFRAFLDTGTLMGGSFVDRFFGFVGPFQLLDSPMGWFGAGLGSDSVYFDALYDPATAEAIRTQKAGIASISSHQGKMLLYGGPLGLCLYLSAWWAAWRQAGSSHPARFMIPTVLAASLFSLGPFFLPYVWLWLAFGSAARDGRGTASAMPGRAPADHPATKRVPGPAESLP